VAHGDIRAGGVAHAHDDGQRPHAPFVGAVNLLVGRFLRVRAAHSGAPRHADAVTVQVSHSQTACRNGLRCRGEGKLRYAVEVRGLGFLQERRGIPVERRAHLHARALA